MLKFLFWILLLANAGLAAYQLGYLDTLLPKGREPTRLQRQIEPERLRVVPEPVAAAQAVAIAAPQPPQPAVCLEVGNFNQDEAQRFVARLGELAARAERRTVQETASFVVYMPPQPDRAGAERKAQELRALGIEDFFIIQDNSSLRWGISLGVFRTEDAARAHLAHLNNQGVRTARIGERSVSASQIAFRFDGLDPAARAVVEQAGTEFARQQVRGCEPA